MTNITEEASYRDFAEDAVGKVDEAAAECSADLPDFVIDGCALVSATIASMDMKGPTSMLSVKLLISMFRNVYKIGYLNGQKDTQAALGVNGE